MKGAIFDEDEINLWSKLIKQAHDLGSKNDMTGNQEAIRHSKLNFILQTLKSYKPHINGNGIKWSNKEKEQFAKLSYKEQRKMIVRKSEITSALFPYVTVDYEPYEYNDRISDTANKCYTKATNLLKAHEKTDFNNIDTKIQQEIFYNLRMAYKEQYIKAGVELAALLFKKYKLGRGDEEAKDGIKESAIITNALLDKNIPENSSMYYQLYKWSIDNDRLFFNISSNELLLNKAQAIECYNHALESVVWEIIDEEAQRNKKTIFGAELYLAAAIKYQSPKAFSLAASNYAPSDLIAQSAYYSIIMYQACIRCSIALGGDGTGLIESYRIYGDFPKSPLKANQLKAYFNKSSVQRGLINGLDPYFDEKFPPDLVIDLSSLVTNCILGSIALNDNKWNGIYWAIEHGYIKDPRTKGSTLESIKEYYLVMWMIIVEDFKYWTFRGNGVSAHMLLTQRIYSKLQYGLPSARPYIFPKEVLDLEIDFTKGLDEYYKTHSS